LKPSAATIGGYIEHTGRIHRIVTHLAMDLDGAGDVAHSLVDVSIVRTTTSLSTLSMIVV
jgi:hypothetical protein